MALYVESRTATWLERNLFAMRSVNDRFLREADSRCRRIVWKNSQNDRSRKSRFRAPNLFCAGNRHDEAHGRATRGKIARAAEPLPNFPSRPSMAVLIVIDAKNRVFPHNPQTAVIPKGLGDPTHRPPADLPTNLIQTEDARKSVRRHSE